MFYCGLIIFFIVPAKELRHLCWKQQQQQRPSGRETPCETVYYQLVDMQMELGTLFVVTEVLIFSMKCSHMNKYPRSFPQTGTAGSLVSPLFAPEGVFIEALSHAALSLLFYF